MNVNSSLPKSKSVAPRSADFSPSWHLWHVSNSVWYTSKGCWSWSWTVGKKHGDNIYIIKLWQILLNMLKINLISAIFTTLRVIWDKKFSSNITISVVASIWIGIRNMSLPGEPTLWQPWKSDTIYVLDALNCWFACQYNSWLAAKVTQMMPTFFIMSL